MNKVNQIFLDLDECMIHSMRIYKSNTGLTDCCDFKFELEDGEDYATFVRKGAADLVDYCKLRFGANRVNILTAATFDYAKQIVKGAGFNIPESQIYARHHWTNLYHPDVKNWLHRSEHNVLIDNLPFYDNYGKIKFLGIEKKHETNYLKVNEFYGTNFTNDNFFENCTSFLNEFEV